MPVADPEMIGDAAAGWVIRRLQRGNRLNCGPAHGARNAREVHGVASYRPVGRSVISALYENASGFLRAGRWPSPARRSRNWSSSTARAPLGPAPRVGGRIGGDRDRQPADRHLPGRRLLAADTAAQRRLHQRRLGDQPVAIPGGHLHEHHGAGILVTPAALDLGAGRGLGAQDVTVRACDLDGWQM
jgi:hypothetical protein